MIQTIQIAGLTSALLSCGFWLAGAGVRIRPLSLLRLRGPESIPAALQRQSLLNAFAAHIPCNRNTFAFTCNFVQFVYVNNSFLCFLQIIIS